jgi:hypothetical protein
MSEESEAKAPIATPDTSAGVAGITFTVGQTELRNGRLAQLVTARWEGREHWSIGQAGVADTAKLLVGAGAGDLPWCAVDAAGETLFCGKSLHGLAAAAPGKAA